MSAGRISNSIGPGCGSRPVGSSVRRVPRSTAGTTGQRARAALARLQQVAASGGNVFAELMECVKVCSLGQISRALYQVGGQYRRNM